VRRATLDMNATIQMFLCLSREADDGLYGTKFLVMPQVRQAIEQQRHLFSGKSVEVELVNFIYAEVWGHPQAFAIAVNNLVRNAFEHTLDGQGPIMIRIKEHELLVTNQLCSDADERNTPTDASSSQGYGLGLGIVQRLCERNGWSFSLRADEERVVARLSWQEGVDEGLGAPDRAT